MADSDIGTFDVAVSRSLAALQFFFALVNNRWICLPRKKNCVTRCKICKSNDTDRKSSLSNLCFPGEVITDGAEYFSKASSLVIFKKFGCVNKQESSIKSRRHKARSRDLPEGVWTDLPDEVWGGLPDEVRSRRSTEWVRT